MGGASPYRIRFIGGQPGREGEDVPGETGEKYFGLVNLKNTCYVNSVLQALYFCTPFRRSAIQHLEDERDDDPGGESLLTSLAELFAHIENQKRNVGCITPRRFLARLRKASDLFCGSDHQDAHEFLQFLLNNICDGAKERAKRQRERRRREALADGTHASQGNGIKDLDDSDGEETRTWIHDILQGHLVNQMKCLCCENVTVRRESFFDLSVDIEEHTSIAACLRAFESTERLRSTNKFFCDTCACLQEAEKRLRICQLPSVLTLHLKRFKYVERLGRCCRLPYRVVFPLQLRVVEHRSVQRPVPGKCDGNRTVPEADGGEVPDPSSQPPCRLFELRSVVAHIGRDSSFGHYVTVVRNGDRCVLLDDDVVKVVEPEILRSFYGTAGASVDRGPTNGSNKRGSGWSGDVGDGVPVGTHYSGSSAGTASYERAPEGTCCGYLLIYEAVKSGTEDAFSQAEIDLSNAADWISEDLNFSDSDSCNSNEDRSDGHRRKVPNREPHDDEAIQAFEQRCVPKWIGNRCRKLPTSMCASKSSGPDGAVARERAVAAGPAPHSTSGGSAWAIEVDPDGTRAAQMTGTGRTLGSVVPAATPANETVSPSRVNVQTASPLSGAFSSAESHFHG